MALGYLAWNAINALWEFNDEIDEIQNIMDQRVIRRMLRDMSNPFECPENSFQSFFRVSRELALDLCAWVRPHIERERPSGLAVEHQVLAALRFFGTGSYQAHVGQDFHICLSQTAVSRAINSVSRIISETLLQEFVKFPMTEEEVRDAKEKFATCAQPFPNLNSKVKVEITNIPLRFANFLSMFLVVCDPNYKILQVNARYGGRIHDAFIWNASPLREHLRQRYIDGERDTWLLGDSGYPLEPWLLTPLPEAEPDTPEYRYTEAYCKTRSVIERCNGNVKSRFGCLSKKRVLYYDPVTAGHIIYACAILHNLRIFYNVFDENDYIGEDGAIEDDGEDVNLVDEHVVEEVEGDIVVEEQIDEQVEDNQVEDEGSDVEDEENDVDDESDIEENAVVLDDGQDNFLLEARQMQLAFIQARFA